MWLTTRASRLLFQTIPLHGPWTPNDKEGTLPSFWWPSTSFTADGDGNLLSAIDLSPNHQDLSFSTGRQPLVVPNVLKQQPAWFFDGIDHSDEIGGDSLIDPTQPFSVVAVFQQRQLTDDSAALCFLKAAGAAFNLYLINNIADFGNLIFGIADTVHSQMTLQSYDYTQNQYIMLDFDGTSLNDPAAYRFWANGILQTLTAVGSLNAMNATAIGNTTDSNTLNGNYFNLFGYSGPDGRLTDADIDGITNSMMPSLYGFSKPGP